MFTTQTAELCITFITFLLSYLVITTGTNMFRAWVAWKMGDDIGISLGFLSPNPLRHIDPIGLFFLFMFNFGWGQVVPIFPLNIQAPWRNLKLAAAYLSDTFVHIVFSIIGITMLLAIFDVRILFIMGTMVMTYNVSHLYIANMYPAQSSAAVACGFVIVAFVYLNVVLGVLNFIMNISNYLLIVLSDRYEKIAQYAHYINIGLPIILILFFSGILRLLVVSFISYVGLIIAHAMGMI